MSNCIIPKMPVMLHGADYNPEQWLDSPEILAADIELMKKAGVNCVSVGIFSWVALEPREGEFNFGWLDSVINSLYENGIYTVLATPTGAKPAWMAKKYPEVCRVRPDGVREHQSGRHNHCYSSPIYREKTRIMNTKLAERYANHPAVILWHISNEIQGECFCDICANGFREWLKKKYGTIDKVNHEWWTVFWGHTYTDFDDIEPPYTYAEICVHGLVIDWKRYCTEMQVDFYREECKPLKAANPDIPATMNMMGFYDGIDYELFKPYLDVISWDCYPLWHSGDNDRNETSTAMWNAAWHDYMRAMQHRPFLMMESTPSTTNWCGVSRQKKPGLHKLVSLQAVAHGSNSVQYFQWRASRGSAEKFHSAVVNHDCSSESRIFKQCADVGEMLSKLSDVVDTNITAEAAILIDMQNSWAMKESKGPRNDYQGYYDTFYDCYRALWEHGIPCDVVANDADLSRYKLVVVPMLYMLRDGISERLRNFVSNGGVLISTYFSGRVNENDLCFLGEVPACGLSEVMGIVADELDALYDHQHNSIEIENNALDLSGSFSTKKLCEISHVTTAEVLGVYGSDYYKGAPAFTVNSFGKGKAYYLASQPGFDFFKPFITALCKELEIRPVLDMELPYGVSITKRSGKGGDFFFVMNFSGEEKTVEFPESFTSILSGKALSGTTVLAPYEAEVLVRA